MLRSPGHMRLEAALASLLILLLSRASSAELELQLQHSVDGGASFVRAGTIQGDLDSNSFEVVRTAAPAPQDLARLVEQDNFYHVRVPTGKPGKFATASVRAACLAASPKAEQLDVVLDDSGAVLSLSYALEGVPRGACGATGSPEIPERSVVSVQRPREGPTVLAAQAIAQDLSSGGSLFTGESLPSGPAAGARQPQAQATGGPTGRPRGVINNAAKGAASKGPEGSAGPDGPEGAEGAGAEAPPPDERTWLQKNWLVVMGVTMAAFNIFGNLMKPPQQAAAAAAGAGGGAGGGARAQPARRG